MGSIVAQLAWAEKLNAADPQLREGFVRGLKRLAAFSQIETADPELAKALALLGRPFSRGLRKDRLAGTCVVFDGKSLSLVSGMKRTSV
jgi:hypothetical protein